MRDGPGRGALRPQARARYAYDASVFRQVPVGVVLPRDADDVATALEVCRRHGAPVLPRGCGTALAGQTVNAAVVFDFSEYLNAVVDLDPVRRRPGSSRGSSATPSGTRPRCTS